MITAILNNKSVWKFIALASYSPGSGFARKEIIELLKWNNLSLDRTLKKLEFFKIIKKEKRKIKLNFENKETAELLEIIEKDKKRLNYPAFEIFLVLNEFLRLIEGSAAESVYLFGSHAKKNASVASDIDIAVFSKKKINLICAKDRIMQEHGKNIQIHYFNAGEKSKIIDEVYKHGVRMA